MTVAILVKGWTLGYHSNFKNHIVPMRKHVFLYEMTRIDVCAPHCQSQEYPLHTYRALCGVFCYAYARPLKTRLGYFSDKRLCKKCLHAALKRPDFPPVDRG